MELAIHGFGRIRLMSSLERPLARRHFNVRVSQSFGCSVQRIRRPARVGRVEVAPKQFSGMLAMN